jgi:protein-L-isoaspartate(D-aspartate) O-methyltransferase
MTATPPSLIAHFAPQPGTHFERARTLMVDGQVRPNKVNDPRIINAMRTLPRERFVPPGLWSVAYADEDVPLGGGRVMMEPMVIARLAQIAAIRAGDRVLVLGAGNGYGAALFASCGAVVTAVEDDRALLALARPALEGIAGVTLVEAPVTAPPSSAAPYDIVLIEGAVAALPAGANAWVRPGSGRLVTVLVTDGVGRGVLAETAGAAGGPLRAVPQFDCFTPALPQFMAPPAFVF